MKCSLQFKSKRCSVVSCCSHTIVFMSEIEDNACKQCSCAFSNAIFCQSDCSKHFEVLTMGNWNCCAVSISHTRLQDSFLPSESDLETTIVCRQSLYEHGQTACCFQTEDTKKLGIKIALETNFGFRVEWRLTRRRSLCNVVSHLLSPSHACNSSAVPKAMYNSQTSHCWVQLWRRQLHPISGMRA